MQTTKMREDSKYIKKNNRCVCVQNSREESAEGASFGALAFVTGYKRSRSGHQSSSSNRSSNNYVAAAVQALLYEELATYTNNKNRFSSERCPPTEHRVL